MGTVLAMTPVLQISEQVETNDAILDAQTIALLCGVVIPLLVGLLSKMDASAGLKAVLNALLSAVAGALATFTQTGLSSAEDWKTLVISILSVWIVSVATYYGVYKPTGVAKSVMAATPRFGLGSPPDMETDDKYRGKHAA